MTSYIDDLAAEYFAAWLSANPTQAQLIGQYVWADRFELCTREEEDRQIAELHGFAAAAQALTEGDLEPDQRITCEVLANDARTRADMLEARFTTFAPDPIFGLQQQLPVIVGMLGMPTADVAEAMVAKYDAVGSTTATSPSDSERAGPPAGCPPRSPSGGRSTRSTRPSPCRCTTIPCSRPRRFPRASTPTAGGPACSR